MITLTSRSIAWGLSAELDPSSPDSGGWISICRLRRILFSVFHTPGSDRASRAFRTRYPPSAFTIDPALMSVKSERHTPFLSTSLSIVPKRFL